MNILESFPSSLSKMTNRTKIQPKEQTWVVKLQRERFPESDAYGIMMELLMIISSLVSATIPPLFAVMIIYEERDPLHKVLVDYFNIKPKMELRFLPLL